VKEGQKKIKELGNVQNWAEVLERDFLVVGEVLRLVDQGSESSWTGSESDWSGEEEGGEEEGGVRLGGEGNGGGNGRIDVDTDMPDADLNEDAQIHVTNGIESATNGKGKEVDRETTEHMEVMDMEESSISENISTTEPSSSSIHTSASGTS